MLVQVVIIIQGDFNLGCNDCFKVNGEDVTRGRECALQLVNYWAAPNVAALFLQHVVRVHGLRETLVSDRDPIFTFYFWRRLLELCGIRANCSSAFHPQTDGQTERMNSVLEQCLRIYTDY